MKNRFNAENLPLSFLDDFHDIEHEEVKQAVRDIVNVMYDDYYSIEEVQKMFSSFSSFAYEIYSMNRYCSNDDDDDFKRDLGLIVEVVLYCASQLKHC